MGTQLFHVSSIGAHLLLCHVLCRDQAELKKHGDEAKISMKEAAAKNLADEALAAANAAHVTAQVTTINTFNPLYPLSHCG